MDDEGDVGNDEDVDDEGDAGNDEDVDDGGEAGDEYDGGKLDGDDGGRKSG